MEQENNIPKNILERLKKLMALSERAGSEAEAENAALRIQELLKKYNLDPSTLNLGEEDKPDILQHIFDLEPLIASHESTWVEDFVAWVAKINYCDAVIYMGSLGTKKRGIKIAIIGKELNIQIVWYTCEQLVHRIRALGKQRFKEYDGPEKRNTYMRGYLKGAVISIYRKLQEAHNESLQNLEFALMVTSNKAALRDFLNKAHPNLNHSQASNSKLSSEHGYTQGRIDGKNIGPNKGLETTIQGTKLIR